MLLLQFYVANRTRKYWSALPEHQTGACFPSSKVSCFGSILHAFPLFAVRNTITHVYFTLPAARLIKCSELKLKKLPLSSLMHLLGLLVRLPRKEKRGVFALPFNLYQAQEQRGHSLRESERSK